MYSYLLGHYDSMSPSDQAKAGPAAVALRLTVSGSSACPVPIMDRWKELTGSYLLERWMGSQHKSQYKFHHCFV